MPYLLIKPNSKLQKADQLKEQLGSGNLVKIIKIGVAVLLLIFFLEFWIVNRMSTEGGRISSIKDQESSLQLENKILQNNIDTENSFLESEKKAMWLGFEPVKNIEFIK